MKMYPDNAGHMSLSFSSTPVSYTHLDVYKRQLWNTADYKYPIPAALFLVLVGRLLCAFKWLLWRTVMCYIILRDTCNTINCV